MIAAIENYAATMPATEWFVYAAMLSYVLGLLFKNQLILRALILIGTGFYIAYYYHHPDIPLWGAITSSILIAVANLIGFFRVIQGRMKFGIPDQQMRIFAAMGGLRPGEFRRLMKLGEIVDAPDPATLTIEGETPSHLYFVVSGDLFVHKGEARFAIPADNFIGEISFVLGCNASATVTMPTGGVYIRWERGRLRRAMSRSFELERAVDAMLSRDMAAKVAASIRSAPPTPAQTEAPAPAQAQATPPSPPLKDVAAA